ncbi:MAG: thioredoxin domain-containing protein [Colwellia sp.]|nr:thioredoxin domain-containing protein [Colwellia sp.]
MTFTGKKRKIAIALALLLSALIISLPFFAKNNTHTNNGVIGVSGVEALFKNRFPDVTIKNISNGPADTWIIKTEFKGGSRSFYLLSDSSHFIEGDVYSVFGSQGLQPEEVKTNTKAQGLEQQFLAKVKAKRSELNNKNNNSNVQKSPSHPFKLPELNSVLTSEDKDKFYERTKELEYIEIGDKSAPLIHVFFDFNCSGCRQAKKVLKKFADNGDLLIRYIPVGVITKESAIKAAYSLIPASNDDRNILLNHFVQPGSADELIKSKAPKTEVLRALKEVNEANKVFMFTPKKLTPTFTFELDGEVVIANLTSEKSIQNLVDRLRK